MGFRLRPYEGSFFESLTILARKLRQGADLLAEVLNDPAAPSGETPGSAPLGVQETHALVAERVADTSNEASDIARSIIRQVNQTFVTPIDREDIYALTQQLNNVMERIDEAADLIMLYEVSTLPKEFAKQVSVLQRCAELTELAMPRLGERRDLADYWNEISELESAGDKQFRRILAKLFDGRYEPLEVIKLKDIISAMEAAIDGFETVADTIEQIVVKES